MKSNGVIIDNPYGDDLVVENLIRQMVLTDIDGNYLHPGSGF